MSPWFVAHQLVILLFGGALLALVAAMSLLLRSVDDAERKHQARLVAALARFVAPTADVGFATGVVYWVLTFSPFGLGKLFACSPPYVHVMFAGGLVTVGLGHVFKRSARRASEAAEAGDVAGAKAFARRAFSVGAVALGLVVLVSVLAIVKFPTSALARCVP